MPSGKRLTLLYTEEYRPRAATASEASVVTAKGISLVFPDPMKAVREGFRAIVPATVNSGCVLCQCKLLLTWLVIILPFVVPSHALQ